jgi:putative Ca2+/H+ antiporter (TMEM165/GDT1 family)
VGLSKTLMDWKLFVGAFVTVFVAELGDKTQLATFGLASGASGGRWTVFAASAFALVCTSFLAVLAGAAIGKFVPAIWLERAGGALMLGLGAWILWKAR